MERNKKISGSITTDQFLYNEIKITAPLYLEGKALDETSAIIAKDNLFQFPTERNTRRITRTCYKRLDALEDAPLYLEGKALDETSAIIAKDNLFQFPTERNTRRITRTCYKRLDALEDREAIEVMLNGPKDISRLINLYAIARTNGLVWEFLKQVPGEKFQNDDTSFTRKDINVFISNLQAQDEAAAKWKGSTPPHIAQILHKFLVEAGYLDSKESGAG